MRGSAQNEENRLAPQYRKTLYLNVLSPNPYIAKLFRLKRANGIAPHKPVLVLTLLELINKGNPNHFAPDIDLVGIFQENWRLLVTTAHRADFTQPYYYLQSDKVSGESIWQLVTIPGAEMHDYIRSVNTLSQVVSHGQLHPEIFSYLSIPENRELIRQQLLQTYFPETAEYFNKAKQKEDGFYHDLQAWILNEPEIKKKTIIVDSEEEIFVRSGLFKRMVPQIYQQTCCISGMRLNSTFGHTYVDACHIVPFSVSHDDRVTNGLALCPNLHRAFDRGLIGIDENYKVLLSAHIHEDQSHHYSLAKLDGQQIQLPKDKNTWPSQEMLGWHRKHRFAN